MSAKNENIHRSERARETLCHYEPKCPPSCLTGEVLVDLLCDLMHWARENDESFTEALGLATTNFEAEVAQEQDDDYANRGEERTHHD